VTQEGSLFQGGSGKDSIYAYTGTVSGDTVQGLGGHDLIQLGNITDSIDLTVVNSGSNLSAGKGSAGKLQLTYSGNYVSAGLIANASIATSTALNAGTAGVTLTLTEVISTGLQSIQYTTVNGNAGNDTITLGDQISAFAGSLVAGGAGEDYVGTYNWGSAANTTGLSTAGEIADLFTGNTINGGDGNDTVFVAFSGSTSARQNTLNGNAGNDSVSFSSTTAAFYTGLIGGGAGEDTIDATFRSGNAWSVNGGAGNDSITFNGLGPASTGLIQGDTTNSQGGNDTINVAFSGASSTTIQGLAGADKIIVSALASAGGSNLLAGNGGNDTIIFYTAGMEAQNLSGWTINGGAGNDSIVMTACSAGALVSSLINGGAGADTITVGASAQGSAGSDGTTINGGAGADKISMSAVGTASGRAIFAYSAYSDSTISTMDTINLTTAAISAGSNSGYSDTRIRFSFSQGGIALATGSGANGGDGGLSASGGFIVWSGFSDTDLTARVSAIDANYTTTGNVAVFTTDGTAKFMFVQGGTTDTVIKLSDHNQLSAGFTVYTDGNTAIGF